MILELILSYLTLGTFFSYAAFHEVYPTVQTWDDSLAFWIAVVVFIVFWPFVIGRFINKR